MASRGTRSRPEVESWEDVGVLAWGSEAAFSRLNRPSIIRFLQEGITGRILLTLNKADLVQLKMLSYGAATELLLAVDSLKAEIGT